LIPPISSAAASFIGLIKAGAVVVVFAHIPLYPKPFHWMSIVWIRNTQRIVN
jgi:hypothetical protein